MPELPEVETVRLYLDSRIVGKTIESIDVLNTKNYFGDPLAPVGKQVVETYRKGKVINIKLNDGNYLSIHLKMSGQVLFAEDRTNAIFNVKIPLAPDGRMPGRTTRVVVNFTDGSAFFFNDLRKFGWVKYGSKLDGTDAPDVTRPEFTVAYFSGVVKKSGRPLKTLLLDQQKLAGVGNIYANDALFEAGVKPSRLGKTLSDKEIEKLYEAIKMIIGEGLKYRGTSASDVYVSPDGKKGSYQDHFRVYGQAGKACQRCGATIIREKEMGRSNFYCPHCQV